MSGLAIPWDEMASGINDRLPEWARYKGYATYALTAYIYVALAAVLGSALYIADWNMGAYGLWGFGVVALFLGNYWRGAAKLRVECSHCGQPARGNNLCPNCGELTYTPANGGDEE